MAREESDREDILREATGLVDRAELQIRDFAEPVVFGFRTSGAVSIFISQAEVYQFDPQGAWRRSYLHGRLLKAERGQLVELTRHRSAEQTTLLRRELAAAEQTTLLAQLAERLAQLRQVVATNQPAGYHLVGTVSGSGADVVDRFREWLEQLSQRPLVIAQQPGLK